ncbi:porin [Variovorax saccharolyticus]|uniref:porin n=1 Tax=Variovorax saccharolyticus TaxID=3053516 RepID=UPI002578DA0A|nr:MULTISPECIES: porin [unclassified Variovorax]MDM0016726.1 porin [Variovorax sp. J22R187]MDM0023276.1 porin [Variovorax sp. J31P216]
MKRSLVAAAACAAVSWASAQSSVTLFGVVDAAVTYTTGSGPVSSSRWQLTNSSNTFSRLGFRGTEDLGGGLAASFWLESGLQNDTGTSFGTNTNNQRNGNVGDGGLIYGRRSTVSLSGVFGEVRLGRDYTPTFWNTALFDPFGTGGGIGANQIYFTSLGGLSAPTGTRASNSVGYFLPPTLGGFYGQLMVALGENPSNAVLPGPVPLSIEDDGDYTGMRVGYLNGPFNVALSTGRTKYAVGDLRVTNLGASYTFAAFMGVRVMGEYYTESLGEVDGKGALLGFNLPVGAGEIKASYAWYRREPGFNLPRPTVGKFALGYVYNLSKRSAVYATAAWLSNSNGSAQTLGGVLTSPDHGSRGTEFGLRHAF